MGIVSKGEEDLAENLLYRGLLAYKIQLVELSPRSVSRVLQFTAPAFIMLRCFRNKCCAVLFVGMLFFS